MSPRDKENTERINVFFSREILEQIKSIAKEKGMTVSGFVRFVVLEYLKKA
ncbi:MAG: hypothetical protein K2O14_03020 [Oscillospiraceae bacterium]|nr:hypothetical protein [Oscillospiraceae bacterium]